MWPSGDTSWPQMLRPISSEAMPADRKIAIDVAVLGQAVLEEGVGVLVRWALADNEQAQEIRKLAVLKKAQWRKSQKQALLAFFICDRSACGSRVEARQGE